MISHCSHHVSIHNTPQLTFHNTKHFIQNMFYYKNSINSNWFSRNSGMLVLQYCYLTDKFHNVKTLHFTVNIKEKQSAKQTAEMKSKSIHISNHPTAFSFTETRA